MWLKEEKKMWIRMRRVIRIMMTMIMMEKKMILKQGKLLQESCLIILRQIVCLGYPELQHNNHNY